MAQFACCCGRSARGMKADDAKRLARAGVHSNLRAVRLHQLRNIIGLPWERESRHQPRPIDGVGVPEVVIAVCTS